MKKFHTCKSLGPNVDVGRKEEFMNEIRFCLCLLFIVCLNHKVALHGLIIQPRNGTVDRLNECHNET